MKSSNITEDSFTLMLCVALILLASFIRILEKMSEIALFSQTNDLFMRL
jgi:hypothetical protein